MLPSYLVTAFLARAAAVGLLAVIAQPVGAGAQGLLRARQSYNTGDYDAAIAAAQESPSEAATIVLARAYLERYRLRADRQDLSAARNALLSLRPERLVPRDRLDHALGVAEAVYLDGAFGAAAELFEPLLSALAPLGPEARERVVDWWASALDADARTRPAAERAHAYERIVGGMEAELRQHVPVGVASYWLAAAALGLGDAARAWQAAVAGWVRAGFASAGTAVRGDLDRLVIEAIIPQQVRGMPQPGRDATEAAHRTEWEAVKAEWPPPPTP